MLRVIAQGIRYRPGRSMVVLLLAMVATAAAVLNPAYTSAAHQSLLTDALDRLPMSANGLRVTTDLAPDDSGATHPDRVLAELNEAVASLPGMSVMTAPTGFAELPVTVQPDSATSQAASQLIYRDRVCAHVALVEGACDTEPGQVLVSRRTAEAEDLEVGDTFGIASRGKDASPWDVTVVGIYEPRDTESGYWGRQSPFRFGTEAGSETSYVDALFVTKLEGLDALGTGIGAGVEYTFDAQDIRLTQVDDILASVKQLESRTVLDDSPIAYDLATDTSLPSVIREIRGEQEAVSTSVPVVTIPLLLLCWFVLYLVVSRLTEERAPQIALAKLRGHRFRSVTGFGTGEVMLLILCAAPLGTVLGLGVVEAVARTGLAQGTTATLTPPVAVYAAVALAGALAAVLLGARHTLNRPVLGLLRAIPARATWRAGIIEGGLVVAAGVAVWQVVMRPGSGVFSLFTTPLLAMVAGVAVARGLEWYARLRQPRAARRGAIAAMLALSQLSRRPETRRIVVLVTVAVALVTFGVCAWDVAAENRRLAADDELGADRVYRLSGGSPETVMDTVESIDPAGRSLMGVMRMVDRYNGEPFTVVAAQTERLPQVARWRDQSPQQLTELAARLHPDAPSPLRVTDSLEAEVSVDTLEAEHPVKLAARVVADGQVPKTVRLGELRDGDKTYKIDLPECAAGCRLIGIGVVRYPGDYNNIDISLTITALRDGDGDLDAGLERSGAWRSGWDVPAVAGLSVDSGTGGLALLASTREADDLLAEYVAAPAALPVALAGRVPDSEQAGDGFEFIGPHDELQAYRVAGEVPVVPRGGAASLMVDLDYVNRYAQSITSLGVKEDLTYEIWANENAPLDLISRLTDAGLVIAQTQSRGELLEQSGRAAPALALRLYLLSGAAAALLVVGVVLLTSTMGAAARGYDNAALQVAGVPRRKLRRAAVREHLYWIVVPVVMGVVVGLVGLVLVLPSVSLVSTTPPAVPIEYRIGPWWFSGALAAVTVGFTLVVRLSLRSQRRQGRPARLRNGEA